ncbi:hypothetical protein LGH82_28505 [Mesorhizobium sp. PAMC28654]|uniref:hypothetical protein n=1 Tax=Mesorhizobium sp. PAMC28654 TaxID=2880934 RepID=UPI001D0A149C|nr:hypothetical protein [Mesorhizobium sp. PAMC28654]UDL88993.1 hypothetical protein LGH82_28505 [Mesorhizobium sp. PAMC28654]
MKSIHLMITAAFMALVVMAAIVASLVKVATMSTAVGHPGSGWLLNIIIRMDSSLGR